MFLAAGFALAVFASGCDDGGSTCSEDEDCPAGQRCVLGACEERPMAACEDDGDCNAGQVCVAMVCQSVGGDIVGGDMSGPDCTGGVSPLAGELVINEIHGAPQSGEDDVNCDGISDSKDEFVEIVNTTSNLIDLAGVELVENGVAQHVFSGCLPAGRGIVVYNQGIDPMCDASVLGETQAIAPDDSFALTNSGGETLGLQLGETELDSVAIPSLSARASWVRIPDFTGDFAYHDSVTADRFSVGRCIGGGPLELGCMPPDPGDCGNMVCDAGEDFMTCPSDCVEPVCGDGACTVGEDATTCPDDCSLDCGNGTCDMDEDETSCPVDCMTAPSCDEGTAPTAGQLKINEVHTAPDSNADDVNCDGLTSSDDEFVEIVNDTDGILDITGVQLLENGDAKHTFGGCLAAGSGIVVYNKSLPPMCDFAPTIGLAASTSFTLTNGGGEVISLADAQGVELDTVTTPDLGSRSSYTRAPDFSGMFTEHASVENAPGRFSVGTCISGEPLSRGCALPMGGMDCGNGMCDAGEDFGSCPADCDTCGNAMCDVGEDMTNCPADCMGPCGDGTCDMAGGETEANCPADCDPCGDGMCDVAGGENATTCVADCEGTCGDGVCDSTETMAGCAMDCGAPCGGGEPTAGQLVFNEVLSAPVSANDDVNCDATPSSDDEFIELVNTSGGELDLAGLTITDAQSNVITIDGGCLPAGGAVVIYNQGLTSMCSFTGDVLVPGATGTFALNNGGDDLTLATAGGTTIDTVNVPSLSSSAPGDGSWARDVDFTGTFVEHPTITGNMVQFSVGTCNADGAAFPSCAP